MTYTVNNPFMQFINPSNGRPVGIGKLYIGEIDQDPQDAPVAVYAVQPDGSEIEISQPVTLLAGGVPSFDGFPIQLKVVAGRYSVKVTGLTDDLIYYTPRAEPSVGAHSLADVDSGVLIGGIAARSVADRVRNSVSPRENGAVNNGIANDTAALKTTFTNAILSGEKIILSGNYLISGPLTDITNIPSGELIIECVGNVSITVSAGSTAFSDVIYFHTDIFNNAIITGGSLTINGNNKASSGITIRHDDTSGGQVKIDAKLVLTNFLENNAAETRENQALLIFGEYTSIEVSKPFIKGVSRTNVAAGATKGVSVAGISGTCVIDEPYVEGVLCPDGGADADGLSVFGKISGGVNSTRLGRAIINKPTLANNKGRSFKSQTSDVTVSNPKIVRTGAVVAIPQGIDFDFQFCGNALLHEPTYEYLEIGGVSPFPVGNSFSSVVFQQLLDDRPMIGRSVGGTMYTQVALPRYALVVSDAGAKESIAEVGGLTVLPVGSFTDSAFTRAILEVDMGVIASKTDKTTLSVSGVTAPMSDVRAIGYTGYTAGDLSNTLSYAVENNTSTLKATVNRTFSTVSGSVVGAVLSFKVADNTGFRDLLDAANQSFSFDGLPVGSKFTVDLATLGTVTNAPPSWGGSGYAAIEVVSQWFGFTDLCIRVTVGNAAVFNTVFYTQDGGTTWGVIK
jgi:hypothetical protein